MSREIGIDLGTSNVLIYLKGHGIILNEPSVVAFDRLNHEIIAIGEEAYEMMGRTSDNIEVIRPLKGGVIADYELAEAMLVTFFAKVYRRSFFTKPTVMISRPAEVSEIEQTALIEAVDRAGGGRIYMEQEGKVAGIGAGIDVKHPSGNMVIDIGGGTTDVVVLSGGDIIRSTSIKVAGDDMNQALIQYFKSEHKLLIGERSAEQLKINAASAIPLKEHHTSLTLVKGRDLLIGLPKSVNITQNQIQEALLPLLRTISRTTRQILEDVPPELVSDIMDKGIILTGGGAMIGSMDTYLSRELGVTVIQASQPMACVALGTGILLDHIQSGTYERHDLTLKQKLVRWMQRLRRRFMG